MRQPFVLQMARQPEEPPAAEPAADPEGAPEGQPAAPADRVRVGFTASRKIGNAVARNRAKRRLREAARHVMPGRVVAGHDYVLVARTAVLTWPYADLEADLAAALMDLARARGHRTPPPDERPSPGSPR